MDSSPQQQIMCLSAAIAGLSQIGNPDFVPDCGSQECAHCPTIKESSSKVESEAQEQARLLQSMREFSEDSQAVANSVLFGKDDDTPSRLSSGKSSLSKGHRPAENALDELCGLESFEKWESIDEIMWSAADKEQQEQVSESDKGCGFEDEEYEIVDFDEAQIDEARVVEMSRGKGKAVIVRSWFARSSSD